MLVIQCLDGMLRENSALRCFSRLVAARRRLTHQKSKRPLLRFCHEVNRNDGLAAFVDRVEARKELVNESCNANGKSMRNSVCTSESYQACVRNPRVWEMVFSLLFLHDCPPGVYERCKLALGGLIRAFLRHGECSGATS